MPETNPQATQQSRIGRTLAAFERHQAAITAAATLAIGFLALANLLVFWFQLSAYKNAEGARVGIVEIQGNVSEGHLWLPVQNYGRQTSPHVSVVVRLVVVAVAVPGIPANTREFDASQPFGGPNQEIPPQSKSFTVPVNFPRPQNPRDFDKGRRVLVVMADIDYDDGFGQMRPSTACFVYDFFSPTQWTRCVRSLNQPLPFSIPAK